MGGSCSKNEKEKAAYRLLVGRLEGKTPLGRPRRRWVDNIRMDLGEVGWGDVDWIGLIQNRNRWRALVNSVLNLRVPWNAGKQSSGLSSSAHLHRVSLLVIVFWYNSVCYMSQPFRGLIKKLKKKLNSMVWVRERTIPTERPPLVGEVIANFCG
jgi:hypothetical protein